MDPGDRDLHESIRGYIVENFLFGDASALESDEQSLLDTGIIDSMGVMELAAFLEQEHGLQIADEEYVPENLDSVASLVAFVKRKVHAA